MEQQTTKQEEATIIRLPRLNLQIVTLLLIIVVAAFQTFQLTTLKAKAQISPAGAPTQQIQAPSNLPGMVGGC